MKAALRAVAQLEGNSVAVLGAMSEVPNPQEAHAEVLAEAKSLGIEVVPFETDVYGMQAMALGEVLEVLQRMKPSIVLVKGSRAATTERVVQSLLTAK
jgi:UDP-N-acetylmuramyl pentapeptide synthase